MRFSKLAYYALLALNVMLLAGCRANAGNFFDTW